MKNTPQKFGILMHARLLPIFKDQGRLVRGQLQRTMQSLRDGHWGGGTRVKILKGVKKAVFEARVNDDLRLLFTVVSSKSSEPPHNFCRNILAWDLVDHDHIDRAKRMNTVPESVFLEYEELYSTEINEPPSCAEKIVSPTEEGLLDFISDPSADVFQEEELFDPIRWYVIQPEVIFSDEEWQRLIDEDVEDLELKLSSQQAKVVYAQGPSLIRGSAGSGKTTVTVYRMARAMGENPGAKILYVTYSEALLASVKRLYKELFIARGQALPENMPVFKTFPQLCAEEAGLGAKAAMHPLRFPLFEDWYKRIFNQDDASLPWEEIRGIIKGACLKVDSDSLTWEEYEKLGRKRAPLFISIRPEIYKIYQSYHKWCQGNQRYDDIDLARLALKSRAAKNGERYDLVICDEGQDLTEVELKLLLNYPSRPEGLFFTADQQQVVNPSGFRWAELNTHLQKSLPDGWKLPEIHTLGHNYRSVQSIVALSNALVELKRKRTGRSDDDFFQESTVKGATPVVISASQEEILQQIGSLGPGCAIITSTHKQAQRLRELTGSERVFDIAEAKGLEFETCLLWDIVSQDYPLWHELTSGDTNMRGNAAAKRILQHAYVAVTRARRNLMIYESEERMRSCWRTEYFRLCTEEDNSQIVGRIMNVPASLEDWFKEGQYYFERQRFRQASECFRRGGDDARADESMAHFYRYIEDFSKAASLFLSLGKNAEAALCCEMQEDYKNAAQYYLSALAYLDAARCFEAGKDFKNASESYKKADDIENYRRCCLQHFVDSRLWVDAGNFALKCGLQQESLIYFTRAGKKQRVFELELQFAEKAGDFEKMGDLLLGKNKFKKAAEAYEKGGLLQQAISCRALMAESSGHWQKAADLWGEIKNRQSELECLAKVHLKEKNFYDAACCYDELADDQRLLETLEKGGKGECESWLRALFCMQEEEVLDAALAFEEAGLLQKSYDLYDLYDRGDFGDVDGDDIERFEEIQSRRLIREAKDLANHKLILTVAEVSEEFATIRLAAESLQSLELFHEAGQLFQRIHEDEEALRCFEKMAQKPSEYYELLKELTGEEDAETSDIWEGKKLSQKLFSIKAKSYEDVGQFLKAAEIYYEAGLTEEGNRCMSLGGMDLSDTTRSLPVRPLFPDKGQNLFEDNL